MKILLNRFISFIFLISFISLYCQFPGLYSSNGLQSISNYFKGIISYFNSLSLSNNNNNKSSYNSYSLSESYSNYFEEYYKKFLIIPSIIIFSNEFQINSEVFTELLLLIGIFYSSFLCFNFYSSSSSNTSSSSSSSNTYFSSFSTSFLFFFIIWFIYLSIFLLSQVFLSFQWDILLLEVGFLTFISNLFNTNYCSLQNHFKYCYRFLIWKLMFMAGVVKLQANCPTWLGLTALEYHFATQCLPNSISWFFHQLHPLILRFGVVFTLLVEIPFTILLVLPFQFSRRIGAILQALLQIFIIFTGNYNFFNLLTLVLLIPVWYSDDYHYHSNSNSNYQKKNSFFNWFLQLIIIIIFSIISFFIMFDISIIPIDNNNNNDDHDNNFQSIYDRIVINLKPTFQIDNYVTPTSVFILGLCTLMIVIYSTLDIVNYYQIFKQTNKTTSKIFIFSKFIWFIISIPITILYLQFSSLPLSGIKVNIKPYVLPQIIPLSESREFSSFHLFSGYGLFRSMTGVGHLSLNQQKNVHKIGGIFPSIVSRPEIILEGYDQKSNTWIEIPFKYKPDNQFKIPPFNLPHQPRLDWQMWFAALGSYDQNPWFVYLIYKLLNGNCPEIISLLDESSYPFKDYPPLAIRSILYEYDFTRLNTTWNQNIPNTEILLNYSFFNSLSSQFSSFISSPNNIFRIKNTTLPWWQRKRVIREYLISLDLTNPSLTQFLQRYGYELHSFKTFDEKESECYHNSQSNYQTWICTFVFKTRKFFNQYDIWIILNTVGILMLFQIVYGQFIIKQNQRKVNNKTTKLKSN